MNQALNRAGRQVQTLFASVEGNARVLVITEGVSAVMFQWYSTYFALYMLALGVTEVQVGALASVTIATQFIGLLLGGYAADRFGRKRMLVIGDILCWGIPMILYAVARNPWYFLVGRFINGFVYIVLPGMDCLFVEDVPLERRPAVFALLRFFLAGASLLAPIAGFLVARWGIVPAGRAIMASVAIAAVATAIYRQFTLHETKIGQDRATAVRDTAGRTVIREYGRTAAGILHNRQVATFLGVRVLVAAATVMWSTYAVIYLTDTHGIGLPKAAVSLLPFVAAVVTMAMILAAAERIRAGSLHANLVAGELVWLASAACLILSPAGTIAFALLSTGLAAVSTALFQPANQSYWAGIVDEHTRAQVFAVGSAATALCSLPAGPLAGLLYTVNPRAPFLLAGALQAVALGLIWTLRPRPQAETAGGGPSAIAGHTHTTE